MMLDEDERVLVLGTHDIEAAKAVADKEIAYYLDPHLEATSGHTGWWRDGMRYGQRWLNDDEVRGAAGVVFDVEEKQNNG